MSTFPHQLCSLPAHFIPLYHLFLTHFQLNKLKQSLCYVKQNIYVVIFTQISVTVSQFMVATSTVSLGTLGSVTFSSVTTLYQENDDMNHKQWNNIVLLRDVFYIGLVIGPGPAVLAWGAVESWSRHHELVNRYRCVCKDGHIYVLFVVITIRSSPHSYLFTWFVTRVTRLVPIVKTTGNVYLSAPAVFTSCSFYTTVPSVFNTFSVK
jgi:hypothetical protein